MQLVYSAISTNNNNQHQINGTPHEPENERLLRYQAYQTTCNKYRSEIAAIQRYIPGWVPKFR